MLKRAILFGVLSAMCAGVSCTITLPGDEDDPGGVPGYVQLDRATADVNITATGQAANASVTASIRRNGFTVELKNGQEVSINGQALAGPGQDGLYTRSVPRAVAYVIRATDPTLGANDTTVNAPPDFAFTSPAPGANVSLAGDFTLSWSNPTPGATYTVTLSQTLSDSQVTTLGPFADDSGSLVIAPTDLAKFRQGANIAIKLSKVIQASAIGGFAAGTARVELAQTQDVVPAP
jgi:hypothetical protein